MPENVLYYGDNLDVMQRHVTDASVDLVYLDPPFQSGKNYNILFEERNGAQSKAQVKAFDDTWQWDSKSREAYEQVVERGGKVSDAMRAFHTILGASDMMAYLAMMAPRLMELKRVLKDTGSIYLHCDTTAGHYLKLLMDSIFEPINFRNQIIWKRTSAHSDSQRYGTNIDLILFYTKSQNFTWNQQVIPHDEHYKSRFHHTDPDGRKWADDNLTAKGLSGGGYEYEYKGMKSLWRCPLTTMIKLDSENRLFFTKTGGIRLKRYLDETKGTPLQALWTDIPPINSQAKERLGYPTQKPEALLERIIKASSNEGDTVMDPFCGCGTTIVVAERLQRRWIGIDITHLAITLMKNRLQDSFKANLTPYNVIGEPVTITDAATLAQEDKYQFQYEECGSTSTSFVDRFCS